MVLSQSCTAFLTALFTLFPCVGYAEDLTNNQARLGGRVFDFHYDVSGLPSLQEDFRPFIHLLDVPWLKDYIQSDPLLKDLVFLIEEQHTPTSVTWPKFGTHDIYSRTTGIPEQVKLAGYETKAFPRSSQWLMYLPLDRPDDYFVVCTASDILIVNGCTILASYPPSPHIRLKARLYATTPWPEVSARFGQMADAMRQVAYCLDITDRLNPVVQEGGHPTEDLEAFFADCDVVLMN